MMSILLQVQVYIFFSYSLQLMRGHTLKCQQGTRQVTQITETGHLNIITLRNIFTFTKRCASSHFSQNSRHPQSNLHFSKLIRICIEQRYIILLNVISAITIHANAIKLQSWGNTSNCKENAPSKGLLLVNSR